MLHIVLVILTLLWTTPTFADSATERLRVFDESMKTLLGEFGKSGPTQDVLDRLQKTVEQFNAQDTAPMPKEVVALEGLWFKVRMKEMMVSKKSTGAALALCGNGFQTCEETASYLQIMTAQCSSLFLGTVNVDKTPGALSELYLIEDSRLMLFERNPAAAQVDWLTSVGVMGQVNPDTVAAVMCPEESRMFGHVLKFFRAPQ